MAINPPTKKPEIVNFINCSKGAGSDTFIIKFISLASSYLIVVTQGAHHYPMEQANTRFE
jgi:hypothetical protein